LSDEINGENFVEQLNTEVAEERKKHGRVKNFIHDIADWCDWRLDAMRNWIRYRTTRRYHIVNTRLPPGCYDELTLVLHACMVQVERFVEGYGGERELEAFTNKLRTDPDFPEFNLAQADRQAEILEIYRWYKKYPFYAKREKELYDALPRTDNVHDRYKQIDEFEAQQLADEQRMLHRLIDIRPHLWT
jgi:hypothetical protein